MADIEDHTEENMADEKVDSPPENIEDELGAIFDLANEEEAEETPEKEKDDETPDDAPEEAAPEEIPDQGAEEEVEAVEQALDAPASWSATAKAHWPKLDVSLQNEILKRESDWQRADGERATKLKGYEDFDRVLEPVRQELALSGTPPAQFVSQLVAAHQFLKNQPEQAFQWLAQTYGFNPEQLSQPDIDPALAPIMQEVNGLKSMFQNFATTQQNAQTSQLSAEIDRFMADPANKYAKRLEDQIVTEIMAVNVSHPNASHTEKLKMAYNRAVRLDDGIQAEIKAEKSAEAKKKKQLEDAERAKKAKQVSNANLSNGGTSGGQTPKKYNSLDDELADIYDNLQGAA